MTKKVPCELNVAIATLEATDQSSCGSTNSLVGVCGDPDPILLGILFEYWSYRAFLLCDPAAMNFLIKAENPKLNLNRMSSWKSAHKLSKCKWYNLKKYVIIKIQNVLWIVYKKNKQTAGWLTYTSNDSLRGNIFRENCWRSAGNNAVIRSIISCSWLSMLTWRSEDNRVFKLEPIPDSIGENKNI